MALKELRQASKTWVASIFVGLLVVSFAIWGVNDVFSGGTSRGVAKVGDQWIGGAEYQQRFRQTLDSFAQQANKQLTSEEIAALGVKEQVLEQLIDATALDVKARALGLAVHDDSLKSFIRTIPAFQGIDGKFDLMTYQTRLSSIGYTPASFEAALRRDITLGQLRSAIETGSYLPRGLIDNLIAYRGETRQVSYVVLDAAQAGNIPTPDDATLKTYIEANPAKFQLPELRSFIAVLFRPQDFAAQAEVTEDEIKASYDFDIDKYKVPEKRGIRAIAFADEASARTAHQEIKDGKKTFEQVGKERGYADADLVFKEQSKAEAGDPKVGDAAFAAAGPGLLEPIDGALAWSIAEVKSITPGSTTPLAEVHDEIKQRLALTNSQDVIEKIVNQFEDGRAGGETAEELAAKLKLKLVKFEAVDAKGMNVDGQPVSSEPEAPQLIAAAFAAEEGTDNPPEFLKDGGEFVVRVDKIEPPATKPFEKIKDAALADYLAEERETRLTAKAKELVTKYRLAGLGQAASAIGKSPVSLTAPLQRGGQSDVLSRQLAEELFAAKQNELVAGPSAKGDGIVIASVMSIEALNTQERAGGVEALAARLDEALGADLSGQYVLASRQNLGVKVDTKTLDTAASTAR